MNEAAVMILLALGQGSAAAPGAARGYTPFIDPLPLHDGWWLTIVPMAFLISVAYKAVRVPETERYFAAYAKQVALMTVQMVGGMVALATVVYMVVEVIVPRL